LSFGHSPLAPLPKIQNGKILFAINNNETATRENIKNDKKFTSYNTVYAVQKMTINYIFNGIAIFLSHIFAPVGRKNIAYTDTLSEINYFHFTIFLIIEGRILMIYLIRGNMVSRRILGGTIFYKNKKPSFYR